MPIFRSRHQADLLAWILLHPSEEYTLTDLAKRIGVPLNTLHREVQRLTDAGLLTSRSVGRSRLLSANPSNRATAPLAKLLELTFGPLVVIGEEFADVPGIDRVIIFGSWAERYSGTVGQPPNDVDVLVIGSPVRADIYDAADAAADRLGMQVNPVLRTPEQWDAGGEALVDQIRSSPNVTVIPASEGAHV
jgi:DNA-binding transcriptional ArsR family regulator